MFCEEIKIPGLPGEGTVTDGSVDWYEMDWENVDNGVTEEQMTEAFHVVNAIRGGAALVIAALKAEGESVVSELWHIDRGYALFDKKLKALGAGIVRTDL